MNSLDQFKQGEGIDNIEKRKEKLEDNKNYREETIDFNAAKDKLKNTLYGNFVGSNLESTSLDDNKISEEEKDIQDKKLPEDGNIIDKMDNVDPIINYELNEVQESKEFPIIKKVIENNGIEFNYDFYSKSIENGKINVNKLVGIDFTIKEEINGLLLNLSENNRELNKMEFSKKIKDVNIFNGFDTKINKDGKFNTDILNVIGEFYIEIPENELNDNIELAIDSARNDILSNTKNLNRNTKTFEKCLDKIDSGDLKEMILGIETLHNLAYSGEGKFAKKKLDLVKDKEKNKILAEAREIDREYKLAQEHDNDKLQKELLAKMEDMKSQVTELVSGEVFAAGEIDKISENMQNQKEVA